MEILEVYDRVLVFCVTQHKKRDVVIGWRSKTALYLYDERNRGLVFVQTVLEITRTNIEEVIYSVNTIRLVHCCCKNLNLNNFAGSNTFVLFIYESAPCYQGRHYVLYTSSIKLIILAIHCLF